MKKDKKGFVKVKTSKENDELVGKVACPQCGSLETEASNPASKSAAASFTFAFMSLLGLSVSFWIPIVGWFLIPVFAIFIGLGIAGGIVFGISSVVVVKEYKFKCNACESLHKINIKEYKELAKENMK